MPVHSPWMDSARPPDLAPLCPHPTPDMASLQLQSVFKKGSPTAVSRLFPTKLAGAMVEACESQTRSNFTFSEVVRKFN